MSKEDTHWADELLQRVRATTSPLPEDAARNLAGIEARLGISLGNPPHASAPAGSPQPPGLATAHRAAPRGPAGAAPTAKGLPLPLKVGLVFSFGVVTGVIGYVIGRIEAEPIIPRDLAPPTRAGSLEPLATAAALEASAPAPAASQTPASGHTPPADGETRANAAAARRRALAQSPASRASNAGRLSAENAANADDFDLRQALELLRRADAALRRSDGLEARMWLSDLDRRAPAQLLIEERLVTRALADCALDDVEEAQRTLHALERANPQSIYRARLEGSCVAEVDSKLPPAQH